MGVTEHLQSNTSSVPLNQNVVPDRPFTTASDVSRWNMAKDDSLDIGIFRLLELLLHPLQLVPRVSGILVQHEVKTITCLSVESYHQQVVLLVILTIIPMLDNALLTVFIQIGGPHLSRLGFEIVAVIGVEVEDVGRETLVVSEHGVELGGVHVFLDEFGDELLRLGLVDGVLVPYIMVLTISGPYD